MKSVEMKGGAVKIKDWGKEKDLKRNRREGVGGAAGSNEMPH